MPVEQQTTARQNLTRFLDHNGEDGARFVSDVAHNAGSEAVMRLFAARSPRQIDRLRARATPEVMQSWLEAPAADRAARVVADEHGAVVAERQGVALEGGALVTDVLHDGGAVVETAPAHRAAEDDAGLARGVDRVDQLAPGG